MAIERTFIAVKPDGVKRGLIPEIMQRFQRRGYVLIAAKLLMPTRELVAEHYAEHRGKPFFEGLLDYVGEGPVFAMVWEGDDIVRQSREMIGATKPNEAVPGTIRKDFCQTMERNAIHGSDSTTSADREINVWFNKTELCTTYEPAGHNLLSK